LAALLEVAALAPTFFLWYRARAGSAGRPGLARDNFAFRRREPRFSWRTHTSWSFVMTGRQGPLPRRSGATRWRKQPGYPGSPHGVGYRPPGQAANAPRNYLVPAVIVTLFCFLPTGIAAIVYAWQARTKKDAGDYRGAVKAAKLARLYTIASLVIGLGLYGIIGLAYLALHLAGSG